MSYVPADCLKVSGIFFYSTKTIIDKHSRASWYKLALKTGSSSSSAALYLYEQNQTSDSHHWVIYSFGSKTYQKVLAAVGDTVFRVLNPRPRRPSISDSSVKELETVSAASLQDKAVSVNRF